MDIDDCTLPLFGTIFFVLGFFAGYECSLLGIFFIVLSSIKKEEKDREIDLVSDLIPKIIAYLKIRPILSYAFENTAKYNRLANEITWKVRVNHYNTYTSAIKDLASKFEGFISLSLLRIISAIENKSLDERVTQLDQILNSFYRAQNLDKKVKAQRLRINSSFFLMFCVILPLMIGIVLVIMLGFTEYDEFLIIFYFFVFYPLLLFSSGVHLFELEVINVKDKKNPLGIFFSILFLAIFFNKIDLALLFSLSLGIFFLSSFFLPNIDIFRGKYKRDLEEEYYIDFFYHLSVQLEQTKSPLNALKSLEKIVPKEICPDIERIISRFMDRNSEENEYLRLLLLILDDLGREDYHACSRTLDSVYQNLKAKQMFEKESKEMLRESTDAFKWGSLLAVPLLNATTGIAYSTLAHVNYLIFSSLSPPTVKIHTILALATVVISTILAIFYAQIKGDGLINSYIGLFVSISSFLFAFVISFTPKFVFN
ncbi:MAG: hypothetical protein ACE5K4_10510 [Candidatus Hydrothermarchaeota archaeon]